MSTDFFRRYINLLNEAGEPPADFVPTHFHKTFVGTRIPLMQTPDGKFWWQTTDPENPRAGRTIQPWIGDTTDRSGVASVDGVVKNGQAVELPADKTWKDASPAVTQTAMVPPVAPPEAQAERGADLVPPSTAVALPSSGTFTNDMALQNLADRMNSPQSRCARCGTKQADHQPLRHAFVYVDDTQLPPVSSEPAVQPGGSVKRGGPGQTAQSGGADISKVTAALTAIEKILAKYNVKLNESINSLTPIEQIKAWRTLLEYSEVDEATRRRPTRKEIENYLKNLPADPAAPAPAAQTPAAPSAAPPNETPEQRRIRLQKAAQAKIDQTATLKPAAEPSVYDRFNKPSGATTGPAQAMPYTQAASQEAGVLSKAWSGIKGMAGKAAKKAALPLAAAYEIYDGYKQISALPTDMPKDQYHAAVTKIVARLIEIYGLFWVGSILGGLLAGAISGPGAIAGFIAGGAGGIAASTLLGDSVGTISDKIVDHFYGTGGGGAGSMSAQDKALILQNLTIIQDFVKANPSMVTGDLKTRVDRVMAAAKAAGVTSGPSAQTAMPTPPAPAAPGAGPKEGDTSQSKSGRPMIFRNGRWEYAN